jgi:hypothetical protein
MADSQRLHFLQRVDDLDAIAPAAGSGVALIALSTTGGSGRKAFFDAVRAACPLDPPLRSERSWDALEDSLWEGLFQLPHRRIVITWLDAGEYRRVSQRDHAIAVRVLGHIADSLADEAATTGRLKDVDVYLA